MTEHDSSTDANTVDEDAFGDTCVLFDYAVENRDPARQLFEVRDDVEKVVSPRIKREFESVAERQQDIHRELLDVATSGELDTYEPTDVTEQSNDLRYVINLYAELKALDDEVEVVRRVNELVNRLEKAQSELFGREGRVTVINVDGLDAQLKGLLSGVVSNDADVRVLCDAVAWRRNGGSGNFLTEDADDILGKGSSQSSDESADETTKTPEKGGNDGLPDSFDDFLSGDEEKPIPEQINDKIARRYDHDAKLRIMSVREFLE